MPVLVASQHQLASQFTGDDGKNYKPNLFTFGINVDLMESDNLSIFIIKIEEGTISGALSKQYKNIYDDFFTGTSK